MTHVMRQVLPGLAPITRLINIVVRGDIQDVRIFRVKRNHNNGIAATTTRQCENEQDKRYEERHDPERHEEVSREVAHYRKFTNCKSSPKSFCLRNAMAVWSSSLLLLNTRICSP